MKLTAISMCKDEADVVERTIRHLLGEGIDEVIIYENGSTDGTWEILRDLRDGELAGTLAVFSDPEVGYYQARKMTELAREAQRRGADWIIPFDADELWTVRAGGETPAHLDTLWHFFARQDESVGVVPFQNFNHYRTAIDPGGHPFEAMGWRDREPLPLPKVAFRASEHAQLEPGNHDVRGARGRRLEFSGPMIHHYPYRSAEQFIRKARNGSRAYEATDLPRSTGQHWREWGDTLREHGEAGLRAWYLDAFTRGGAPADEGLVFDPVRSRR